MGWTVQGEVFFTNVARCVWFADQLYTESLLCHQLHCMVLVRLVVCNFSIPYKLYVFSSFLLVFDIEYTLNTLIFMYVLAAAVLLKKFAT